MDLGAEQELLRCYRRAATDDRVWRRYQAMKCVSLLREALWSMTSELYSKLDFDYGAYTDEYLARFERACEDYRDTAR